MKQGESFCLTSPPESIAVELTTPPVIVKDITFPDLDPEKRSGTPDGLVFAGTTKVHCHPQDSHHHIDKIW
ncbi:hypothetical protein L345_18115, partial [Ophiophagus hannah]